MSAPDLQEIRSRVGGLVYSGGRRWIGPGPGHSRRDQSLSVVVNDDGRLVWHSFAGDPADAVCAHLGIEGLRQARPADQAARQRLQRERQKVQEAERRRKLVFCADVWNETVEPEGTPVEAYLRSRALTRPIPDALRYHPAAPLDYDRGLTSPAMVAMVQASDGSACGIHVTALTPDGSAKAFGSKSRRMFGNVAGGAVRLSDHADELAVAEGIETALAFMALTGTPTWACLSTAGLTTFRPPPRLKTLTIAADGDQGGLKAAQDLIDQARRHCDVVLAPAPDGRDWNDELGGVNL